MGIPECENRLETKGVIFENNTAPQELVLVLWIVT